MKSGHLARRLPAFAGGAALIALVGLSAACGSSSTPSPSSTTTTTTTTTTSVAPTETSPTATEKNINPSGGNKFSPTVLAPPPATAIPGTHHTN
jgi:hypothetical protein